MKPHQADGLRRRRPIRNRKMLIRNQRIAKINVPVSKSSARNQEATLNEIQDVTVAISHAILIYFSMGNSSYITALSGAKPPTEQMSLKHITNTSPYCYLFGSPAVLRCTSPCGTDSALQSDNP